MKIPIYQVDAFTSRLFGGNPAAVCPLEDWLEDEVMQKIAIENNLAETAFFILADSGYHLRWFTPEFEVDLCGHATLASAHVLYQHLGYDQSEVIFQTLSGEMKVSRTGDRLVLDFPVRRPAPTALDSKYLKAFSIQPQKVMKASDYFLVYNIEEEIRNLSVNPYLLDPKDFNNRGIICTAEGDSVDFVSRFFLPGASVFEDPVTGSAHCSLVPYWSSQLGKKQLLAHQLSQRGGVLHCEDFGERVLIAGEAATYLEGVIMI